ncbi:hypothetical protein D3C83_159520 [compost metagenome]
MSARAFACGVPLSSMTVSPVASSIIVQTPLVVLGACVFFGAEVGVVEAVAGAVPVGGLLSASVAGSPVVAG